MDAKTAYDAALREMDAAEDAYIALIETAPNAPDWVWTAARARVVAAHDAIAALDSQTV